MVVAHNLLASNANRNLGVSTGTIKKHTEKLSSGYKINRAADDAAGLTISEKMRSQIRGLTQASANAQDGISFVQTADGTLDEVSAMLKRSKELAVKASTETLTEADRQAIQSEIKSICDEIDRVQESSTFNDFRIFTEGGYPPSEADMTSDISPVNTAAKIPVTVTLSMVDSDKHKVDQTTGQKTGAANAFSANELAMADFVNGTVNNAIKELQEAYPNLIGAASTKGVQVGLVLSNIDGGGHTLAQIEFSVGTGGGKTSISYTLRVDTSDYDPNNIDSWTDEKKSDLAATIAHEMTHVLMLDTMPQGMFGALPLWFVEGVAQTSSGDGGWIERNPSDAYLQSKIKDLYQNEYGTGYLAAMYMGSLAGNGDIKNGLDKVLTDIANGMSLSDSIKKNVPGYDDLASFESAFINGSNDVLTFAKNHMASVGSNGAGSLFGNLNDPQTTVFPASTIGNTTPDANANYTLNPTVQSVSNGYVGAPMDIPASQSYGDGKGRIINLQVGAANRNEQRIPVKRFNISCDSLFEGQKMDMSSVENSRKSLERIDKADLNVSKIRSYYGAIQNRLEHTIANLDNVVENTTAAESLIRDTDMAKEMVDYTKVNVLIQAGNAMLSQAMQTPQNVLQLLS